jgi:hypothetical protein
VHIVIERETIIQTDAQMTFFKTSELFFDDLLAQANDFLAVKQRESGVKLAQMLGIG